MRKLYVILCFAMITHFSFGQSEKLEELVDGMIQTIPDLFDYHPYQTKIHMIDVVTKNEFEKKVILMTSKECFGTILGVKMNENLAYVAGYAPIIRNNKFTGEGEFILYKKENGKTELLKKVIREFTKAPVDNEIMNELEDKEFAIRIRYWEEVQFMIFEGYAYLIPLGYFKL